MRLQQALFDALQEAGFDVSYCWNYISFVCQKGLHNIYSNLNLVQLLIVNQNRGPQRGLPTGEAPKQLVFHGTNLISAKSISEYGINLNLESTGRKDFGKSGFYVTPNLFYATRVAQKYLFPFDNQSLAIVVFILDPEAPIDLLGPLSWSRTLKYNRHDRPEDEDDDDDDMAPRILAGPNCINPTETDAGSEPLPGRTLQLGFINTSSLEFLKLDCIIPFSNALRPFEELGLTSYSVEGANCSRATGPSSSGTHPEDDLGMF